MLAWPERGYEKETTGFPLEFAEDATDERYRGEGVGGHSLPADLQRIRGPGPRVVEPGAKYRELGILCRGEEVDVWLFDLGEKVLCHAAMKRPLRWTNLAPRKGIRNGIVDARDVDCLEGDVVVPCPQVEISREKAQARGARAALVVDVCHHC